MDGKSRATVGAVSSVVFKGELLGTGSLFIQLLLVSESAQLGEP